jgi:hypothetical protein
MKPVHWILAIAGTAVSLGACARSPSSAASPAHAAHAAHAVHPVSAGAQAAPAKAAPAAPAGLPKVVVHRSPSCGCCGGWVDHMRRHGFPVEVRMTENLEPVKKRLGVPFGKGSCHTAEVAGLFVEGHVPAADVARLLAAPGGSRGLVLPGMPIGSPGMESPDGRVQRYTVEKVGADGRTTPFATHGR